MFTHAACLLLRWEGREALAKLTEIARPLACPSFGWARGTITLEPIERLGLLQDYRRFPPAKVLDAFVDDRQERRETCKHCKQAEDEIQIGMVPTHVQLPLELAPPKGGERPAALRPRNGDSASWQRQRNAPRCRRLLVAGNPVRDLLLRAKHLFVAATFAYPMRAGPWAHRRLEISLTASFLARVRPCCCFAPNPCSSPQSFGRALNSVAPHDDKRVIAMTNEGRPGPPHCGVSGRRLAARAYARRPARRDA
jgi:hypothetical protein